MIILIKIAPPFYVLVSCSTVLPKGGCANFRGGIDTSAT